MKPVHFDLTVSDLPKAKYFFEQALGWQFERFPMPYEYYRITAGPADEQGIDGGIGQLSDSASMTDHPMISLTIPVPLLASAIEKIETAGGRIIEPRTAIPSIGWHAICAEPGGLMFGLLEVDSTAK